MKRGRKDCVSVLMEYKADPNVFNKAGDTPLMIAAAKGRTAIAVILMQNEANSNLANSVRGRRPRACCCSLHAPLTRAAGCPCVIPFPCRSVSVH